MSENETPAPSKHYPLLIIAGVACLLPAVLSLARRNATLLATSASVLMSVMFILMGVSDYYRPTRPERSRILDYAYKAVGVAALLVNGWLLMKHR